MTQDTSSRMGRVMTPVPWPDELAIGSAPIRMPPELPPIKLGSETWDILDREPALTVNLGADYAPEPLFDPDELDDLIGQRLGDYTIRRKLAEGGMGVVYLGVDERGAARPGRVVAIKVLRLELSQSTDMIGRFYQEAYALHAIRHPNVVEILDFGRDAAGRAFFVMEYLQGEPLSARIRRGGVTWREAFPILQQTLGALKAAHDLGFVHRDIKPDNIWLTQVDGRVHVKLLDFGIAKLVDATDPREPPPQGALLGTPHYMSPEQINGSPDVDHRTDIYALGVIMYEMFAGITPFGGETLQAIMSGHLFMTPPRLVDIPAALGVPASIAWIVDRMLVKEAAGRYASASAVLGELHDAAAQWATAP